MSHTHRESPDKYHNEAASSSQVADFLREMALGRCPQESDALWILQRAKASFARLPSLVRVEVPSGATLHVVGDLHGQYCELMTVLDLCGMPNAGSNMFFFNGDFVDRGRRSVEVILALLLLVVAYPGTVYLNRGNHETRAMNRAHGFQDEVLVKFSEPVFEAFQDVFGKLPLAGLINEAVFITHGGLFRRSGVSLGEIAAIDRFSQSALRSDMVEDLLWSDPSDYPGRRPSPRGAGIQFGPDVTQRFCEDNDLLCCIRSHEVKESGYEWQKGGRCLTVFSAANYMGRFGNLGAVCHLSCPGGRIEAADITISTFVGATESLSPMERRSRLQLTFPSAALRSRL